MMEVAAGSLDPRACEDDLCYNVLPTRSADVADGFRSEGSRNPSIPDATNSTDVGAPLSIFPPLLAPEPVAGAIFSCTLAWHEFLLA